MRAKISCSQLSAKLAFYGPTRLPIMLPTVLGAQTEEEERERELELEEEKERN